MKKHTKIAIAAGIAVIGGIALASAGIARGGHGHFGGPFGGGRTMMLLEQLDLDQDEKLTQAEIDEAIRSRVNGVDANGDGQLSLEEFEPLLVEIMRPRIVDGFQFLDADGDAVITMEEIDRPVSRLVSHLDRNDDGELTANEVQKRHRGWRYGHHDRDDEDDG